MVEKMGKVINNINYYTLKRQITGLQLWGLRGKRFSTKGLKKNNAASLIMLNVSQA